MMADVAENEPPAQPQGPPAGPQGPGQAGQGHADAGQQPPEQHFPAEQGPPTGPISGLPPEPGSVGPSALHALPAGSSPAPMPPGMDADEYRRFQEFQRFQDYQRFVQGQQPPQPQVPQPGMPQPGMPQPGMPQPGMPQPGMPQPGMPQPGMPQPGMPQPGVQPGGGLVPLQPGQPAPYGIEHHLSGMQQQLAELTASQARIERVTNPPTWQKILRNKWLHRLLWLVIIILLATWGVPKLVHHYFGGETDTSGGSAALPLPKEQSGELPEHAHDAVYDVYLFIAGNHPVQACFPFSNTAAVQFANAAGTGNDCQKAVTQLHSQLTNANAYANTSLSQLPIVQGTTVVVSSCDFDVTGGPRLGTFTVTQQSQGWEITDYAAPAPCPPPTSGTSTSTPPTS
jgi:hypothetical protein